MRRIGIDQQFYTVYQDEGIDFHEVFPAPSLFEALFDPNDVAQFSADLQNSRIIFREDSFDPTTRLRRGRFYERAAALPQPSQQGVLPRTAEAYERSVRPRTMFVFDQCQFTASSQIPKFVAIGTLDSMWRVLSRPERLCTGEFLFFLKARHGFGVLPEINALAVPESGRQKVIETLDRLTDAANRESPGSVIDRSRDAAQWCLATSAAMDFSDAELLKADLGEIIRKIRGKEDRVLLRAGEIVQRLHSRAKPNEQERHRFRPPLEDDADFAVKAVGFIIRELGWANG